MIEQEMETPPPSSIDEDEYIDFDEMEEIDLDDIEMEEEEEDEDSDIDDAADRIEFEPSEDHAFMVFDKHVERVFCCDLHPDGKIAVTGSKDNKAYVWSVTTGEVIMECSDRRDSVTFVGFSFDGAYLAVIDMVGIIRVYKCNLDENQKGKWPLVFEYEAGEFVWGLWHFGARVLIVGAEDGEIFVFKIPTGETKVLSGHNVQTDMGKMLHDGRRLVSGYSDGVIKIWDLKSATLLHQVKLESGVRDIDVHQNDTLLAAISTRGTVVLITPNNGKIVAVWEGNENLEVVAFSKNYVFNLIALGGLDGSLSLWDTVTKNVRSQCTENADENSGVIKIVWINDKIVAGRLDGTVRAYDARTNAECMRLTGHRKGLLDICYNPKQNIILTTSYDCTARIYKCEFKTEKQQVV